MRVTRGMFGGAVFLASFLLFLIEPMAAKQLVPLFGGSAAVWITCLVFFQTALLAGYAYAHWLVRGQRSGARWWASLLHIGLLLAGLAVALVWAVYAGLGMRFVLGAPAAGHPVRSIFAVLAVTIGLPFLLLASTSPLLQAWYARATGEGVPYRLFALSNLASLLALGLYPSLIEPHLALRSQQAAWVVGFVLFAGVCGWLAWEVRGPRSRPSFVRAGHPVSDPSASGLEMPSLEMPSLEPAYPEPVLFDRVLWLVLPLVAAMQLSAVTAHLTENIAAIPLLWVLPLAVYLLTLILAFEYSRWLPRPVVTRFLALMLASLGYMLSKVDVALPVRISIPFYLLELFVACLFCHAAAYTLRPQGASRSTSFYLMFAAGGALGSFLIGIACPLLFSSNYDLALSFLATALVALAVTWQDGWPQRLVWSVGCGLLVYLLVLLHAAFQYHTLLASRNFYGSLRVEEKPTGLAEGEQLGVERTLMNGTIRHGMQMFWPGMRGVPTTYYAEDSGIGLALRFCCTGRAKRVGVVGLGVGTIAAYGRAGDTLRFYEINPAVPSIAEHLFTYLRDTPARVSIVEGDARQSLAEETPQHFDVLAIDAFSGDAIPVHLLTREAMQVYAQQLTPGGILAFHVSNQYVDLEPVVALLSQAEGMHAQTVLTAADTSRGEFRATWVLVTRDAAFFQQPGVRLRSVPAEMRKGLRVWTDDYSSLLPVLY